LAIFHGEFSGIFHGFFEAEIPVKSLWFDAFLSPAVRCCWLRSPFKGEHPEHPRSGETLAEYATFSAFGRDRVGAETVRGSLGNLGILMFFFHQKKIMEEIDFRVNFGTCWWILDLVKSLVPTHGKKMEKTLVSFIPAPFRPLFLK